jgi:hypothetical protein
MPLRSSGLDPDYLFETTRVGFYMNDDNGAPVRCTIDDKAMHTLVPTLVTFVKDEMLSAFQARRTAIEDLVRQKYDRREFAHDGTIEIKEADVP